jgi:RNA polymerase sigma-70 factor (ECF subfamily)
MTPSMPEPEAVSLPMEDLIRACIDTSDAYSWEEFVRRTHAVIAATVFRTARRFGETSPALIADLVQDVYLRICDNRCRVLREFHADAPEAIFGLMKAIAFTAAQDHFRAGVAKKRGSGRSEETMDSIAGRAVPAAEGAETLEREILLEEIDRFLACSSTERRIFWLYYRHGYTSRAIAALPGIGLTQKGVESTLHRLTSRVKEWLNSRKSDPQAEGKASGTSL